jgi:hypothetical protein
MQSYYHVLQVRRLQASQTILRSYFKNKSEGPPVDPKTAEYDPVGPADPHPGQSSRQ